MAKFGWIHLSGAIVGAGAAGSLQFPRVTNGVLTGSDDLVWNRTTKVLNVTGTINVSGTINARQVRSIHQDIVVNHLSITGSTKFGNDKDDTHAFSGSIIMSGAFKHRYHKVTAASYTIQPHDGIVGIAGSSYVSVNLPGAAGQGGGRVLIIKDESTTTRSIASSTHIALTASGGDEIDHQSHYLIEGDSVAVTLYSDGVDKWFIY